MNPIGWIVIGFLAGAISGRLIGATTARGCLPNIVVGIAGALLGGWLATKLFHVVTLHGFFNISTWLTAIAGAALLLLAYHLLTSRSTGRSRSGRSRRWAHR